MSFALEYKGKNKEADSKTSTTANPSPHHRINNLGVDSINHLQHTISDQAVLRLIRSNIGFDFAKIGIYPELKVSQPGDLYEQEADRLAEEVMTMLSSNHNYSTLPNRERIDHECAACVIKEDENEEKMKIARKTSDAVSGLELSEDVEVVGAAGAGGAIIPCVQPINWTHFGPVDHGPDGIRISIRWDSSSGKLDDLKDCEIREIVNYDPIPNPPFIWDPTIPNPTIITVPAKNGAAQDTHSYPPGLKTGITNPRQRGTMTANQVYQYKCTGAGCSGNWTDFPGQTYSITREVFGQFVRPNPWRYKITKQGVGNMFNYSREVEIPEP